jgi:hypothetical protein
MPQQRLTDRVIAPYITGDTLIHIVNTGDTTQYAGGSSYKATIDQVATYISQNYTMFSGGSGNCITDLYVSNLYGCSPITVWDNLTLSGSVIDSQGGGYLDLRYGNSDGEFYLGNDNGNYSDTFIYGSSGYLEMSAYDPNGRVAIYADGGNAGISITNNSFVSNDLLIYTNTTSIESTAGGLQNLLEVKNDNISLNGNGTVSLTAYPHVGVGVGIPSDLLIISNISGLTFTTESLRETNPSLLSSQYSTIVQGVKNSVGLGGYNLNVNADNTAFVDNLNIKTIGSGTPIFNLGLDSSGNVVTGVTSSFTGGTVPGETIFTGGLSATTISATTIGSPTDCVDDLYVYNIHSCSPLNINPLDEGNVYFGSNSGITIDLANERLGVGTNSPQYPLQVVGTNSEFYYDPTSTGGRFNIFSSTGIPRFDVAITFNSFVQPATGGSVGMRTWTDTIFPGYGGNGDMFLYAGANTRNLNIINAPTSIGTPIDNIRFYAGTTPDLSTAHMFVDGSGVNKGFVGIGTESPSEKLDVSGKTKTTNFQMTSGATSGYVLTSDASGNASWQNLYGYQYFTAVTITSAQTLSIGSIPVQVLPAPGTNKYYDIKAYFEYVFNTTAYSSTGTLVLADNTTKRVTNQFDINGQLTSRVFVSDMNFQNQFTTLNSQIDFTTSDGSDPTLGDGSFKVKIYYNIIDFG